VRDLVRRYKPGYAQAEVTLLPFIPCAAKSA
jgi:hypothetical protein